MKGINLKNDQLISMNVFDPLKTSSYIVISNQPGIKRLHISDIPSCNRATKGSLIFKSPKTNVIHSLYTYVLDPQDSLKIYTEEKIIDIDVKDYSFSQLMNKPSVLTMIKNQQIQFVYQEKTLTTDMYHCEEIKDLKEDQLIFNQSENHDEVISKIELDYFFDYKKEIEIVDRHEKDIQNQEIVKEKKE